MWMTAVNDGGTIGPIIDGNAVTAAASTGE